MGTMKIFSFGNIVSLRYDWVYGTGTITNDPGDLFMSDIMISTERKYSATVVSNTFIDRFLAQASGAYVKVYLFLLRCNSGRGTQFSITSAADFFDENESDIVRALRYWAKKGVLRLEEQGDEITGITILDLSSDEEFINTQAANCVAPVYSIYDRPQGVVVQMPSKEDNIPSEPAEDQETLVVPNYTREEINDIINGEGMSWILDALKTYLSRNLEAADFNLVVYLLNDLKFSPDLIFHLYDTCVSRGKQKIEYITKTAFSWYEAEITTPEEAKNYTAAYSAYFAAVNKAFNLSRLPGDKEEKYIKSWQKMGFEPDVIKEACDRTLMNCGKPQFKYVNTILTDWSNRGVKTLSDVRKLPDDRVYKKPQSSKPIATKSAIAYNSRYKQREYSEKDFEEIERQLFSE